MWTYTLDGPLSQLTSVYAILHVVGTGSLVITGISANVITSEGSSWTSEGNHTYVATVTGSFQQATESAIETGGDVLAEAESFTPRAAAWDAARPALGVSMRAGPYYLLASVFDIPDSSHWTLRGADVTYRTGAGASGTLAIRGLGVQVETPLSSN